MPDPEPKIWSWSSYFRFRVDFQLLYFIFHRAKVQPRSTIHHRAIKAKYKNITSYILIDFNLDKNKADNESLTARLQKTAKNHRNF